MGAWAYCQGKGCEHGIQRDDYSMQDVIDESYTCPSCGHINEVVGWSPAEALQELYDRVTELEKKIRRCLGV